ncbi:Guanylate kinase [bacterium HR17]|uniref:Guanylate kinase n=1 Tax=Candidatus Fervidibacter japonicus TaxID=2035412 RepID=A0A2H5XBD4_9BACT|nr:Guanylate kinase [bacterium HR17]
MPSQHRGRLFVVSGPSGVGKGTLVTEALKRLPHMRRAITYTTRPPRSGEVAGQDYHFVSPEEFERLKDEGAFLEWAEVYGNFYGSPRAEVERLRDAGYDVVLVLDVQGALTVKRKCPEAILIFVEPPSIAELQRRLEERGTDPPDAIARRLAKAQWEMEQAAFFDHRVLNDTVERAVNELVRVLQRPDKP